MISRGAPALGAAHGRCRLPPPLFHFERLLEVLCRLLCEPCPEDQDEEMQLPAHRFAGQALDAMALHLPAKHIYPLVANFSRQAILSPSWTDRRAAVMSIALIAEGCSDAMRKHVSTLLVTICQGIVGQPHPIRGEAGGLTRPSVPFQGSKTRTPRSVGPPPSPWACLQSSCRKRWPSTTQRSCLWPAGYWETQTQRPRSLPATVRGLSGSTGAESSRGRPVPAPFPLLAAAVEGLSEALEDDLLPYLDAVMTALLQLMHHGVTK